MEVNDVKNMVWKTRKMDVIESYMLRHPPTGSTIFYDKIEIDQFGRSYELYQKEDLVAVLDIKSNRIKNLVEFHDLDKPKDERGDKQTQGSPSKPPNSKTNKKVK